MKITLNWLKEFVDFDLSPEELADKYDLSGTEVEAIEYLGKGFEHVVVGEVLEVNKHPNADRLQVCEVDIGDERVSIVCGAPNVATGQKVAVARPGAVLPNGMEIKETKLRGVTSAGMICSETELGLAGQSAGIMVLAAETRLGDRVGVLLGVDDWLLELEVTPNRPDCMSMIGMARETAALVGGRIRKPAVALTEHDEAADSIAAVTIEAPDLCPRYSARYVDQVEIGPSPHWMRRRLEAAGIRSLNNIVDVTNYVMLETGQPLHAFDYELLRGGKITVRRAKTKEKLETIDHVVRELITDHLVIADQERVVALAGVMGGFESEINDKTTKVLIESANFHAPNIRKTSRSLGLISESSLRFERGVDISGTVYAAERAAQLLAETAGGRVWSGTIDAYPRPRTPKNIELRPKRVHTVLGIEPRVEEVSKILTGLELEVETGPQAESPMTVTVPTVRVDLEREIDLIEEIARFYGINDIEPRILPSSSLDRGLSPEQKFVRVIRDFFIGAGFTEVINYSFISRQELDRLELPADHVWSQAPRISNPLSEDQALLRTTLLSSLLQTVTHNYNRDQKDLAIFEIGNIFRPAGDVPEQSMRVAGALTGWVRPGAWHEPEGAEADFYDLKGLFELICDKMNLDNCHIEAVRHPALSPGQAAELVSGSDALAFFGTLHPKIQENYSLRRPVFVFEADVSRLFAQATVESTFHEIPRFPAVVLDLAMIIDEDVSWGSLEHLVRRTGAPLLKRVHVFDLYRGEGVPEGKKSLAFNLTYQAADRTLTDNEIDRIQKRIIKRAERELGAQLRD